MTSSVSENRIVAQTLEKEEDEAFYILQLLLQYHGNKTMATIRYLGPEAIFIVHFQCG